MLSVEFQREEKRANKFEQYDDESESENRTRVTVLFSLIYEDKDESCYKGTWLRGEVNKMEMNKQARDRGVKTVVCLVTWPLNESEAGVDLVMIQTSLLFL